MGNHNSSAASPKPAEHDVLSHEINWADYLSTTSGLLLARSSCASSVARRESLQSLPMPSIEVTTRPAVPVHGDAAEETTQGLSAAGTLMHLDSSDLEQARQLDVLPATLELGSAGVDGQVNAQNLDPETKIWFLEEERQILAERLLAADATIANLDRSLRQISGAHDSTKALLLQLLEEQSQQQATPPTTARVTEDDAAAAGAAIPAASLAPAFSDEMPVVAAAPLALTTALSADVTSTEDLKGTVAVTRSLSVREIAAKFQAAAEEAGAFAAFKRAQSANGTARTAASVQAVHSASIHGAVAADSAAEVAAVGAQEAATVHEEIMVCEDALQPAESAAETEPADSASETQPAGSAAEMELAVADPAAEATAPVVTEPALEAVAEDEAELAVHAAAAASGAEAEHEPVDELEVPEEVAERAEAAAAAAHDEMWHEAADPEETPQCLEAAGHVEAEAAAAAEEMEAEQTEVPVEAAVQAETATVFETAADASAYVDTTSQAAVAIACTAAPEEEAAQAAAEVPPVNDVPAVEGPVETAIKDSPRDMGPRGDSPIGVGAAAKRTLRSFVSMLSIKAAATRRSSATLSSSSSLNSASIIAELQPLEAGAVKHFPDRQVTELERAWAAMRIVVDKQGEEQLEAVPSPRVVGVEDREVPHMLTRKPSLMRQMSNRFKGCFVPQL